MSLLSDAMENCIMYDKRVVDDSYGGYKTSWFPGVVFEAAIVLDDSINAQVAMSQGSVGVYTVTTSRKMNLQFRDVFKRVSDGKFFRVTTDGDDKKTPKSTKLDMRQVRAEEWSLPNG